ncbi:hypothetical protein FZC66_06045 [Priestia megaterium]|nr:hypothetical protein FZC66_06045 [Priestia megaterium]
MNYTCPCCGYQTLEEEPPDTFDICSICYLEDDELQFYEPDYEGGANQVSLKQAQQNFLVFGACEEEFKHIVRKPTKFDKRDVTWRLL